MMIRPRRQEIRAVLASLCALAWLLCASASALAAEAPKVEEQFVTNVASSSATLSAKVNPEGATTKYTFEYAPAGGAFVPVLEPEGKGSIAEGTSGVPIGVHVQHGLLPNTAYQFRLAASNSVETVTGEPASFTTQGAGAFALLDGRQWELVSPPDKHGALVQPISQEGVVQAAAGGGAITYLADAPTETQPQGYSSLVQVFSPRGAAGWDSRDIATPHETQTGTEPSRGEEYRFFSSDLSRGVLQPFGGFIPASSPDALAPEEASEQTAFLRTNYLNDNPGEPCTSSCYRPLVTGAPGHANVPAGTAFGQLSDEFLPRLPCPPALICGPVFVGASLDATHVVMSSSVALTSTPLPSTGGGLTGGGLYEWSEGGISLISVLPENEGGAAASGPIFGDNAEDVRGAISTDGSRVFWTTRGNTGIEVRRLYMREPENARTLRLDAVQGGEGGEEEPRAEFQLASSNGSRVFFRDPQRLTSDSGGSAQANRRDLYECIVVDAPGGSQCVLLDLTPLGAKGESAEVQGSVIGANEAGCDVGSAAECSVYFVANGVLANNGVPVAGAVHGTCEGEAFQPEATCNLYVHRGHTTRLVAVLSGDDKPDWGRAGVQPALSGLTARVSPDGRWLAFMTQRSLTGYDNRDAISGEPDEEVYLYDADSGSLVCASCNPTGARPEGAEDSQLRGGPTPGNEAWEQSSWLAGSVPGWTPYRLERALYQSRYLADSGRLFFNSSDALVSEDVNGTEDVYQFEPAGVGGCTSASVSYSATSGSCIGLVSSGSSADESGFLDASESGGDVFFLTAASLSPADFDKSLDVYDAHECTSAAPCFPDGAAPPRACSTGDSCKPAPSPQPGIFGSPASATFSGSGNITPPPSAKPKTAAQIKAEKLAKALKACRARHNRHRRTVCEAQARKKYGRLKAKRSSDKRRAR